MQNMLLHFSYKYKVYFIRLEFIVHRVSIIDIIFLANSIFLNSKVIQAYMNSIQVLTNYRNCMILLLFEVQSIYK